MGTVGDGTRASCRVVHHVAEALGEGVGVLVVAAVSGLTDVAVLLVVDEAVEQGGQGADGEVDVVDREGLIGGGAGVAGGRGQGVQGEPGGDGAGEELLPLKACRDRVAFCPLCELCAAEGRGRVGANLGLRAAPGGVLGGLGDGGSSWQLCQRAAHNAYELLEIAAVVWPRGVGVVVAGWFGVQDDCVDERLVERGAFGEWVS
jgi:hypothetical protein